MSEEGDGVLPEGAGMDVRRQGGPACVVEQAEVTYS